jgi:hypothetical protein
MTAREIAHAMLKEGVRSATNGGCAGSFTDPDWNHREICNDLRDAAVIAGAKGWAQPMRKRCERTCELWPRCACGGNDAP